MHSPRRAAEAFLPIALALLFFAAPARAAQGSDRGPDRGTIRFRLVAEPATLDWNLAQTSHETYVVTNVMEGLFREGEGADPAPALAERWSASDDRLTYTFYLKAGVKWSDGRALKASDFVDSWLRLLNPKTGSGYGAFLSDIRGAEAYRRGKGPAAQVGVRAIDDGTLQVTLARPAPHFLHLLTFWVTFPARADLIRRHGARWATPGRMATLGPYLLEKWEKGARIVLKRNPGYHAASAYPRMPERVEAVIEPDDSKARSAFEAGTLDFLLDSTTPDLVRAKASPIPGTRIERFPYLATYYLGFNVGAPGLKDTRVRRALALALDREAIPAAMQGGQRVAKGWLPPGIDGAGAGAELRGTLYDARGLLTQAGFPEGARFPRLELWVEKLDGAEALAALATRAWRERLGIEIDARIPSPQEFQAALRERKAPLFIGHWGADFPEAANFLDVFASGSRVNATGWESAAYDEHLAHARAAASLAVRRAFYAEAEKLLVEKEVVIVPLFQRANTVVLGPRMDRFRITPLNYLFFKDVSLR